MHWKIKKNLWGVMKEYLPPKKSDSRFFNAKARICGFLFTHVWAWITSTRIAFHFLPNMPEIARFAFGEGRLAFRAFHLLFFYAPLFCSYFFLCITFFTFIFISPKSQLIVLNLSQSKSQPFTTSLRCGFVDAATSFHFLRRGHSFVVVHRHRCRLRFE
jgi:hypothetical protein